MTIYSAYSYFHSSEEHYFMTEAAARDFISRTARPSEWGIDSFPATVAEALRLPNMNGEVFSGQYEFISVPFTVI